MIFTPINTGSAPNDGTGDTPRAAAQKINSGFEEVEARLHDQGEQIAYAKRSIDDVVALAQESAEAASADRQQTGEDRDAVEAAAIAVAADRVQTGLDRTATHADAVSTAADRTAAAAAATTATDKATIATTKAGEAAGSATAAAGSAIAAANSATAAAASAAIADRAAGGSAGQVQYNVGGVLTGGAGLTFDGSRLVASGGIGIGAAPGAGTQLRLSANITGAIAAFPLTLAQTIQSDVTFNCDMIRVSPATQAASFTLGRVSNFRADGIGLGAGSVVTESYGFWASSSMTAAGLNAAFRGEIPSGAGRWNLYMVGTAANYLAGGLSVGSAADAGAGNIRAGGTVRPGSFTVATLPSASGAGGGAQAFVTDASTTTYRAVVAGGGSEGVTVTSIGGQWLIGA
ncbi:MAG: hypothetical protein ACOY5R_10670 [Pseudomonadota bacterium]